MPYGCDGNSSKDEIDQQLWKTNDRQFVSLADELRKLAKLEEEGILTKDEFKQLKQQNIKRFSLGTYCSTTQKLHPKGNRWNKRQGIIF
jgi:hypothetical protein